MCLYSLYKVSKIKGNYNTDFKYFSFLISYKKKIEGFLVLARSP